MNIVPVEFFLTKGVGRHKEKLVSFELALRDAGVSGCNLVKVSSIVPPMCEPISREAGLAKLQKGQILFCVQSENSTNEAGRIINAAVGLALPSDWELMGYLSEHHDYGKDEQKCGEYAEDLAAYMLATLLGHDLGLEFNTDSIWDQRAYEYKVSPELTIKPAHISVAALGSEGLWTTALAYACLLT